MFTDMFSYTQAGQMAGKRLRVTKTQQETNPNTHQNFTQTAQGDLNLAYTYNNEGKVTQVTYPTDINSNTPAPQLQLRLHDAARLRSARYPRRYWSTGTGCCRRASRR